MANSMGTSVGSGAITLKQAVLFAAIFEFAGALLVGTHVTDTVRKGILDPLAFSATPPLFACGMLASLIATALCLNVATYFGLPVSTTHAIVGAVIGFGVIATGIDSIHWGKVGSITASWVLSPLFGGIFSFAVFRLITRFILGKERPYQAAVKTSPALLFLVVSILMLSVFYKGLKNLKLQLPLFEALLISLFIGLIAAVIGRTFLTRSASTGSLAEEMVETERIFGFLQAFTACYVAFAHGANDVANAIGPLAAVVSVANTQTILVEVPVPLWILVLGGAGIVVGLATYGYKVIETVGRSITELNPSRGFCAQFAAATTVLFCSKLGLPVSTTHTLIGSIIGVGFARGIAALDLGVIRNILGSWVITIPSTACASMVLYKIMAPFF